METLSGTAAGGNPPRGHTWIPGGDAIAVEPGGTDLHCTVTVAAGGAVEWQPLDSHGVATGGWSTIAAPLTVNGGQRVALRPAAGSAAVLFAWSGTGLEALAQYRGSKGTKVSWG